MPIESKLQVIATKSTTKIFDFDDIISTSDLKIKSRTNSHLEAIYSTARVDLNVLIDVETGNKLTVAVKFKLNGKTITNDLVISTKEAGTNVWKFVDFNANLAKNTRPEYLKNISVS